MDSANFDLVARLMEQTGLWYTTGDLPDLLDEPPGELGSGYTLTWINAGPPDKSVAERTIRQLIYLDAKNGPVIYTPDQIGLPGWGPGVIGWFAAPSGLRDTLAELGVPMAAGSSFNAAAPSEIRADTFLYLGVAGLALIVGLAGLIAARRTFGLPSRSSRRS
jgi:hypothetical protein